MLRTWHRRTDMLLLLLLLLLTSSCTLRYLKHLAQACCAPGTNMLLLLLTSGCTLQV
jgi:hypothetical protein